MVRPGAGFIVSCVAARAAPVETVPTAGVVSARPAIAARLSIRTGTVTAIPAGTVGVCTHPGSTKPGKSAQAAPFDQLLGNLFQEG